MRFVPALLLPLMALSAAPAAAAPLDRIAQDYVKLTLEAGEREPGYVDAYYGPAAWAKAAKAKPRAVSALRTAAAALKALAFAVPAKGLSIMEARRRTFMIAQLTAAETRLAMLAGEKFSFVDEAEGLFSVRPETKPLQAFDPLLAKVEALVPGEGPLWKRVDDFRDRFVVPSDRVKSVMDAAIAECRSRTAEKITLPPKEKFTLELVTGKPWSGYNYYKGSSTSLIQVNTDLPFRVSRAVDLGCHEGYPGHHALNMLLEQKLTKERGWIEFSIYPLYSPLSLIAEGSANYGIELAFPSDEQQAFEADVLYPVAGLDPALAPRLAALQAATRDLAGAELTIRRDYLDGRIGRAEAAALIQKYALVSEARALKSLDFTDTYRSYVINYGLGLDMVRAKVERAGPGQAERWKAMEAIISEPTLPSDLLN